MKHCLPIVFALVFIPVSSVNLTGVARSNAEIIAQAIEPGLRNQIEQNSVRVINRDRSNGLGIILSKQDNRYLVLTSSDVTKGNTTFTIKTIDGQTYSARLTPNATAISTNLRLLEFTSEQNYIPAELNPAARSIIGQEILIVGDEEIGLTINREQISQSPNNSEELEQFGYTHNAHRSSTIKAIYNSLGTLIGFSGGGTNSFITLNSFLQQLNPEVTIAYNLKLPDTAETITSELSGQLKTLEDKAKKITVKITSSSGNLGSGVIVKRDRDTYTVLTSAHVVCEQDELDPDDDNCADNNYQVITSDNQSKPYQVKKSSIKSAKEVDLARLEFTSTKNYQVATLADYAPVSSRGSSYAAAYNDFYRSESDALPSNSNTIAALNLFPAFSTQATSIKYDLVYEYDPRQNHYVFAAGYAKKSRDTESEWQFNPGYAFDRKTGSFNIYDRSSFDRGYELVYTCITSGGMSGGPILDVEGRVIGIHGKAEGEKVNNGNTSVILGYSLAIPIGKFAADESLAKELKLNLDELNIETNQPTFTQDFKNDFEQAILTTETPNHNTSSCQWIDRGNKLWRLLRYKEAEQSFQQAINQPDPNCIKLAWYGKGLSLIGSILSDSAATELEKNEINEKYRQAAVAFAEAVKYDPQFFAAIRRESITWIKLNRFESALAAINRAIELEPGNSSLYNDKGALLTNLRQFKQAEIAYKQAISHGPLYYLSYYNRGLIHGYRKEWDKALTDFNQAITYEPTYAPAYFNRGNVFYAQEKITEAKNSYEMAIKHEPEYPQAHHNLGYLYDKQQNYKLALEQYNKAIELDSKYLRAYINRGRVYAILNRWNEAFADYNEAIEVLGDVNPETYLSRGLIRSELGDKLGAINDLQQAQRGFFEKKDLEGQEKVTNFLQQIQE